MIQEEEEEEEEIHTLEETRWISFWLSGPSEELSRNDQPNDETANNEVGCALPMQGTEETVSTQREGENEDIIVRKRKRCIGFGRI